MWLGMLTALDGQYAQICHFCILHALATSWSACVQYANMKSTCLMQMYNKRRGKCCVCPVCG